MDNAMLHTKSQIMNNIMFLSELLVYIFFNMFTFLLFVTHSIQVH